MRCEKGKCRVPAWMGVVLAMAGLYCTLFAGWVLMWPLEAYTWLEIPGPCHAVLMRVIGGFYLVFGLSFFLAARDPIQHWRIVLLCTVKILLVLLAALLVWWRDILPMKSIVFLLVDDVVWLVPFLMILWAAVQAKTGRPPLHEMALSLDEASRQYTLSSGESLEDAAREQTVVLVFLRHFGCTFTRQLLRGLELIEAEAKQKGARLVLVHMLQSGRETEYLGHSTGVARIADPYCELYRAFGLGKAGVWELFGPRVWYRGMMALFRGCGVGHLAGDGLQMPGVFLFRGNRVLASQPAKSAADLPDLETLFSA